MRKVLYLLVSLTCIFSGLYLNAQETVVTGSCGATENDNLTWTLDTQSNTLTISGSGAMTDYDNADNKAPWLAYSDDDIETLKLEEGITHIGNYAFYNRTYFSKLRLPYSLTSIGDYAFYRCLLVKQVTAMPETAPQIGSNTFYNVSADLFYNHNDLESKYNSNTWASSFSNRKQIYIDKVGEKIYSIVNPNIDNGTHYIIGTGAMYDYDNEFNQAPYRTWTTQYPCNILSIEEGITHIGDYAFPKYNNSWTITSEYTSCSIPLSVTTIGDGAFSQCFPENSELTLLTADHNVTHIGDNAFHACGGQFSFPETLIHIGNGAFSGSYIMTSLTLPENLEHIGDYAFSSCPITGDLTIPNSVTYLGSYAFSNCIELNGTVTLSANMDTIREYTFSTCQNITGLVIPEGIVAIDKFALYWCLKLTGNLTIPNSITSIGKSAFKSCESLNGSLTLSENLSKIEEGVFSNCNFTGSLVIPENVTSIGNSAFENCDFTGKLNIHDNITSIGSTAFLECNNITELVLGTSLTGIGGSAFKKCSSLSKVTSLATTAPTLGTEVFTGIDANAILCYPEAGQQSYTDNGWLQYFSTTNNQMCGNFAFYDIDLNTGKLTISGSGAMWDYDGTTQAPWRQYATQITSVEIHDGITSIGNNAFYGMSALTGIVTIPESVTLIGESAFQGCTNINELTIYDGLTNIENYAFYLCVALNKVTTLATTAPTLGSDVFTNIATDATLYCQEEAEESYIEKGWEQYFTINAAPIYGGKCGDNITWSLNLTTGELVVTGTGAMWDYLYSEYYKAPWYEYNDEIKSLTLSEGITHIGNYAFELLVNVEGSLVLPTTLTSIGESAFKQSNFTGTLTIPNSVIVISRDAFNNNKFSEINISENVQEISAFCFQGSDSLTNIIIPEGVTIIGDYAFYGSDNLTEIHIPSTVIEINPQAFNGCNKVNTCTVLATTAPNLWEANFSPEIYETATLYYHADATDYEEEGWFDYFANRYAVYTGTCGEDAYWTLNVTTGELRIYGTGAMDNYYVYQNGSYTRAPWRNYKDLITSVVVEKGITNVGNYAFYDPDGLGSYTTLTSFTLANTVTSIGNGAFRSSGLTNSIEIPASVRSIGASAFNSCTGITALDIAGSASIGEYTFSNCTGITSITNTNISKVTSIGNYAFQNCTGLKSVVIPSYVTSIGDYAFNGCTELFSLIFLHRTITIGFNNKYSLHDLTSIGNYAFDGCSKLVGMEKNISPIFMLPEYVIALFIPYSVKTIGDYAFRNCTSIPQLSFESGGRTTNNFLTSIGQYAFYGCTSIMGSLNLSSTKLTNIGYRAFQDCKFMIINPVGLPLGGTLSLPNTLTKIEDYAFYGTGFKTVTFPESLQEIGQLAFAECSRLTAVDLSKTNLITIGYSAFENCTKISSLQLPVNVQFTELNRYGGVFKGCTSLKEVVIPNNITDIGSETFYGCTSLERVVLPNNLDYSQGIGSLAFGKCPNIKEVYATQVPAADEYASFINVLYPYYESAWNNYQQETGAFTVNTPIDNGSAVLYIPIGAKNAYTYRTGSGQYPNEWEKQFPVMIEGIYSGQCGENAYYIGNNASYYYHSETQTTYNSRSELIITGYGDMYDYQDNYAPWRVTASTVDTLIIDDNITSVGNNAFSSLSIDVLIGGSGIKHVGEYGFYYNGIATISIADYAYIGNNAFRGCSKLAYDDFIANASYIGDYAFYNCDNLILDTELNLKNATYIGADAFNDCAGFTGGLKIGKATTIGEYAFYQVNFTGDLVIPESVTSLGAYAFYGCDNFNGTLTLPETLETINNYTFASCSGFTGELVIPNSITSINERAFSSCSGFTGTLVIPENVTTIGNNAFSNCNGFTALELNDNITTIGNSAFHYCNAITGELVLPYKLANIGNSAFNNVTFTDVVSFRTQPATLGTSVFNAITGNVYIPYQYKDAYLNATNWSAYSAKMVAMPTYIETSGIKHWVGLSSGIEPLATDRVALDAALDIEANKTLNVESFGYCGLDGETFGYLTVKDCGQLFHNKAYNPATLEKEINGYAGQSSTDNGQQTSWYTIASPLNKEIDLSTSDSLFLIPNSDYDLYRYDEPSYTWQNSKPGDGSTNFQNIEPGRGYLYASAEKVTLQFNGDLNIDTVTYNLTAQGEKLTGFHLIGNPFAHDIYMNQHFPTSAGEEQILVNGYYVLTGEGAWAATASTAEAIKPGQGILVKSLVDNYELAISRQQTANRSQQTTEQQSLFKLSVTNGKHSDRAYVVFSEGAGLDKINHENENIPLLYIPQDETDYAIAMMDKNVNEIPVNFETNVMGEYTISLQQENSNFSRLYLLDKETGEKVNILEEDYTFMAMSGDNAERFVLTMANGDDNGFDSDNSHFAYVNDGNIVIFDIEGDAKIRIIDALGRCLYKGECSDAACHISTGEFANGVYVIEKIDNKGNNVQKIIL